MKMEEVLKKVGWKKIGMVVAIVLCCAYGIYFLNTNAFPDDEELRSGESEGHEYVDLGLSVEWATCNIGAGSPTDYVDYYAWGETSTKANYESKNSKTYKKILMIFLAIRSMMWPEPSGEEIGVCRLMKN